MRYQILDMISNIINANNDDVWSHIARNIEGEAETFSLSP